MPKRPGQGERKSTTRKAVAIRRRSVAETYLATGGDVAATAAKHKVSPQTVRVTVRALDEEVLAAMERANLSVDGLVIAYKDALVAEKHVVSPLGHVIASVPDHSLRVMSADKLLNVLVKLQRQRQEAEQPSQLPQPAMSIEDFRALPDGERIRVLMQQKTVVIEAGPRGAVSRGERDE